MELPISSCSMVRVIGCLKRIRGLIHTHRIQQENILLVGMALTETVNPLKLISFRLRLVEKGAKMSSIVCTQQQQSFHSHLSLSDLCYFHTSTSLNNILSFCNAIYFLNNMNLNHMRKSCNIILRHDSITTTICQCSLHKQLNLLQRRSKHIIMS